MATHLQPLGVDSLRKHYKMLSLVKVDWPGSQSVSDADQITSTIKISLIALVAALPD